MAFTLICCIDDRNTVYNDNKRAPFAWSNNTKHIDLLQVYVTKPGAKVPSELALNFIKQDAKDGNIIYYHESLLGGFFHSGLNKPYLMQYWDKSIICSVHDFFKSDNVVFTSGIVLDRSERLTTLKIDMTKNEKGDDLHWHNVHPSDLLENCFDGYGMVDIVDLEYLKITVHFNEWLNISKEQFGYIHEIKMTTFPLIIHPFRLDKLTISAKWNQPSKFTTLENHKILWERVYTGRCNCGCMITGKQPSDFDKQIQMCAKTKHQLNYLYYNQSPEGKQAAFTKNGIYPRYHLYMTQEFKDQLYDLLLKDDIVLTKEKYAEWKYIDDIKHKRQRIETYKQYLSGQLDLKKHLESKGIYNDQGVDHYIKNYNNLIKKYKELPDEVPLDLI